MPARGPSFHDDQYTPAESQSISKPRQTFFGIKLACWMEESNKNCSFNTGLDNVSRQLSDFSGVHVSSMAVYA